VKFERWGDIPDKTLLVKNEQGLILDPEFEGLSEQEKLQYFDRNSVAIPEARKKMIKQHLNKSISIKDFELKQFFLKKGELGNSEKCHKLKSDKPNETLKQIKNETEFFGLSFLEGFLEFYGIKLDMAVERYEKQLHIIEEENPRTHDKNASIIKSRNGIIDKIVTLKDKKQANRELEKFYQRKNKEKKLNQNLVQKQGKENKDEI
jgi:hypothetical protein